MISEIIIILILTFAASAAGSMAGFGVSTIMVAVLLLLFPVPITLLFAAIIRWFNNIWRAILFKTEVSWSIILFFGIPALILSYIAARVVIAIPEELLLRILGIFLLSYSILILYKPNFKLPKKNITAFLGGALSGFIAGIFGTDGPVRAASLYAFKFSKKAFIFASAVTALMMDSTRVVGYITGGVRLEGVLLWGMIIFIPASLLGAIFGKKIIGRVSEEKFNIVVSLLLILISVKFILFP